MRRWIVPAAIIAYVLAHALVRSLGLVNISNDDTTSAISAQSFELGYWLKNPPLYDWGIWLAFQAFGPGIAAIQLAKAVCLAGGYLCLHLAIRDEIRDVRVQAAIAVSYVVTAYFGWEFLVIYSHSFAMFLGLGVLALAFMRVLKHGQLGDFALLGIGIGICLLGKPIGLILLACLCLAALWERRLPNVFWLAGAGVLGAAIGSPYYLWLLGAAGADDAIGRALTGGSERTLIEAMMLYAQSVTASAAIFLLPVGLFAVIAFRGVYDRFGLSGGWIGSDGRDVVSLSRKATLIGIVIVLIIGVMRSGDIEYRYAAPALILLPVALFGRLDASDPVVARGLKRFLVQCISVTLLILVFRAGMLIAASPPVCVPRCASFHDYAPVAAELNRLELDRAVIVTDDHYLGANLVRLAPDTTVRWVATDPVPRREVSGRRCALIWQVTWYDWEGRRGLNAAFGRAWWRDDVETPKRIGSRVRVESGWMP
ncbi:MAG: glycosyltransferase family 39 protein, partial [Pseudomonadota bacterium]